MLDNKKIVIVEATKPIFRRSYKFESCIDDNFCRQKGKSISLIFKDMPSKRNYVGNEIYGSINVNGFILTNWSSK